METSPNPPVLEDAIAPSSSAIAKLFNVLATPGDVFEEISRGPARTANWLLPLIVSWIAGIVFVLVVFSQPAIQQRVKEAQEKRFHEMAEKQHWSPEQTDAFIQKAEAFSGPRIIMLFGSLGAIVGGTAFMFLVALLTYLIGAKALGGNNPYMQHVEMVSLASMVSVVGILVNMLLVVAKGNIVANLGLMLLVNDFNLANKWHQVASAINLPDFWYVTTLGIGLSKLSKRPFVVAAAWVLGGWLIFKAGAILLGMSAAGM